MNAHFQRQLIHLLVAGLMVVGIGLLLRRLAQSAGLTSSAYVARDTWSRRVREQRLHVSQRPRDPSARLKLAHGILELAQSDSLLHDLPGGGDDQVPTPAERDRFRARYASAPETEEAERLLWELTRSPHPYRVRARAWEVLAVHAARMGNPLEWDDYRKAAAALRCLERATR
jgi:hypothetical protein